MTNYEECITKTMIRITITYEVIDQYGDRSEEEQEMYIPHNLEKLTFHTRMVSYPLRP